MLARHGAFYPGGHQNALYLDGGAGGRTPICVSLPRQARARGAFCLTSYRAPSC
jgi:hypothetical protein